MSSNLQLPAHAQGSPQAALQGWPQAGTRWPHRWSHTSREQGAAPHFRPHFRWAHRHTHFSRQEDRGDSPHRPLLVPWGQLKKIFVPDQDPNTNPDPRVFGPPRSGSFYHETKKSKKSICFVTFLDFLSLKNDVNYKCTSKMKIYNIEV
jgi:hypothetical protein